jgi:polar amino acid transport system ATP-binding protein
MIRDKGMNATEPIVSLKNVEKSFGGTMVLKDISLEVAKGEVVSIIGSSGGGKSTLLRCATLLETFEKGSLEYGDVVVAKNNPSGYAVYGDKSVLKRARFKFGLVFQNFNLFPHRTVLQNVTDAPVRVQKRKREEVESEARALLDKFGLGGKEDMVPNELSGGQQQRVAIARALCTHPEILYFDEPTSALDPELTQDVLMIIRELAQEHMTMVVVTHEMNFARDVSDRIIFMDKGVIVEEGSPTQVIDNPQNDRTRAFLHRIHD